MKNNRSKQGTTSLQKRLTLAFSITSAVIFAVNLVLFFTINRAINQIDEVYRSNMQLSELSLVLDDLQNELTDYLNSKSSQKLGAYYESQSEYEALIEQLHSVTTDDYTKILTANINQLSSRYLETCESALTAKRGRNIQKYRTLYTQSQNYYDYIKAYLYTLNNAQLQNNSVNYLRLRTSFRTLELISMFVLVIVTAANLLIILITVRSSTRPLSTLAAQANEISNGNFDVDPVEVLARDEIGVVTEAFNAMVVSIRGYIERLRESMENENRLKERELLMDAHLKEAELKYLQAQINPHFLFNTLNAGAQLSMLEHADLTYRYLQNVAAFFRAKTNRNNQITTLAGELALVDNYIYIINVRFSGSISYEKHIDDDLTNVSIPSMILQPVVENAINHGLRDVEWAKRIVVSVYRTGPSITISVKDNGIGMTQEQIEKILNNEPITHAKGDETNGVGLSNVINRLRLFYDSEDVFDLTSAGEGKGTEVLLYIPMPK